MTAPGGMRACPLDVDSALWISALQRFLELLKLLAYFPHEWSREYFCGSRAWSFSNSIYTCFVWGTSLSSPIWKWFIPVLSSSPHDPTHFYFKCLTVKMSLFLIKSNSDKQIGHEVTYKVLLICTRLISWRESNDQVTLMWFVSDGFIFYFFYFSQKSDWCQSKRSLGF